MKKVFAFLSLIISLGLSSVVMAQGPADYSALCTWDETSKPRKMERGGMERIIQSLEFTGATDNGQAINQQVIPVAGVGSRGPVSKVYVDKTDYTPVRVSRGDEIIVQPRYHELYWMHFYLYVDFNQDGVFAPEELVSYTHYREDGSNDFYDSKGNKLPEPKSGDVKFGGRMPSFIVPADAKTGQMRARFKVDWNNKDACGANDLHQNRGTICDFAIEVLSDEQPNAGGHRLELNVEGEGSAKFYDALTDQPINNISDIQDGDLLQLRFSPNDGYELKELTVNDEDMMGARDENGNLSLIAEGEQIINVKFGAKTFYSVTVTVSNPKDARVVLVKEDDTYAENGDLLEPGTQLTVMPFSTPGRRLTRLIINGEDRSAEIPDAQAGKLKITINQNLTIHLEAERIMETLVYEFNEEGGKVKASLEEDGTSIPSGGKAPQLAKVLYEVETNEGYELTSVARRNAPEVNLLASMTKVADNVYSVPVRENDPGFIFTFTKTTGIEDIKALGYSVRGVQGMVIVEGATSQTIELYNLAGVCVAKTDLVDARVSLHVAKGVYVVKIGKATAKVIVH